MIDPGHGGFDGGAISKSGTVEKDINLKISNYLKKNLEGKGYVVVLTRDDDKGLYSEDNKTHRKREDLENRCKIKEESKCDMFISIHLNEFYQSKYSGAQVWYSKYDESKKLAHILQENLRNDLDKNNNRVEKAAKGAYKILRCKDNIPSVIVECGFLSNLKEERYLKDDSYQQKIAESICKSVIQYYESA